MNTNKFFDQVEKFISKDDLKSAIALLLKLLENSPKLNEVVLQSARFNDISRQVRLGLVDFEELGKTKSKIRYALLDMIRDIEESVEDNPETAKEMEQFNKANSSWSIKGKYNILIIDNENSEIKVNQKIKK